MPLIIPALTSSQYIITALQEWAVHVLTHRRMYRFVSVYASSDRYSNFSLPDKWGALSISRNSALLPW